jgi:outer membrane receptor protein involved in Fe transport
MSKSTVLPNFRSGIVLSFFAVMLAVAGTPLASAQDAADEEIENIIVTGSHIKRDQSDMPSPIQIIDSETLANIGANSLPDLVNTLTINTGAQIYVQNLDQGRSAGTTNINLRGLGEAATLVLLNGTRNTLTPAINSNGDQFTNLSVLVPMIAIERVEILKDGASALYGSDAVAGVVNFITRDTFEGFEIKAETQNNEHGGDQLSFGLIVGGRHERGNFMVAFEYLEIDPVENAVLFDTYSDSMTSFSGFSNPSNVFGGGVRYVDPECDNVGAQEPMIFNAFLCRIIFGYYGHVIAEEQRMQAYGSATYEFTENSEFFGEFTFADNEAIIGSVPTQPMTNPVYVPENHPDVLNIFAAGVADPFAGVLRTNPDNGDLREVQWFGRVRGAGFPQNNDVKPYDAVRVKGGLRGDINDTWDYTVSYAYSRNSLAAGRAEPVQQNLQNALYGRGGPNQNEWYHFAWSAQDQNTEALFDDILGFYGYEAEATQKVFDFVVSGGFGEIGGGTIGAAFGVQYREDTLEYDYNDQSEDFAFSFFVGGSDFLISQDTTAVFGELSFPFSDSFEVNVAVRYEEIESASTTDPKVSFLFTPTDEWSLRASWGTSFKVPSLFINGGVAIGARTGDDPQKGVAGEGIAYRSESTLDPNGPALVPQEADNYNLGATYAGANGLTVSLDYWSFEFDNFITYEDHGGLLTTDTGPCIPDPAGPTGTLHPQVTRSQDCDVISVTAYASNAGFVETDGIDLHVSWAIDSGAGMFTPYVDATLVLSYDIDDPTFGPLDALGVRNVGNIGASNTELRANLGLNWALGNHGANLVVRYIDDYLSNQEDCANCGALPDPADWYPIDSMTTIDVQYSYRFENLFGGDTGGTFRLGSKNASGEIAPQTPGTGGYDERVHDPRGRYVYASLSVSF